MDSKPEHPGGAEDRVSQLPDDIRCHILSYLPTVDSVRTMVLSKRWNNSWTFVPALDLEYTAVYCTRKPCSWNNFDKFAEFVDGALSLHNSSTLRRFRLHIDNWYRECDYHLLKRHSPLVQNWIFAAMRREVSELDILFHPYPPAREIPALELPARVVLSKTLEVLKVDSNCITYPPTSPGCFPSLKFADITARNKDNSSLIELFCNCPELQTLRTTIEEDEETREKGIFINAPKLQNFDVYDAGFARYIMQDAKSLVRTNVDARLITPRNISPEVLNRAAALFAGVSGVKYLHISGPNLVACSLPNFSNLKQLKLDLFGCCYSKYLMELLKRSPKLEDLVLDIIFQPSYYHEKISDGYEPFKPPEIVPICVVSHLKTVSITCIWGNDDQLDVVKYLLEYGQVLRNVTVHTSGALREDNIQRELLMYPNGSSTCEVEVQYEN